MTISFDIDNTLILYSNEFEIEALPIISKILGAEALRIGTKELFTWLEERGHHIWIYTTSYRSIFKLKKTFLLNGLHPKGFINETINQKQLKKHQCKASKHPKLFGINIHVDDSEGVGLEGKKYGFKTIIINPDDKDWIKKIMKRIELEEDKLKQIIQRANTFLNNSGYKKELGVIPSSIKEHDLCYSISWCQVDERHLDPYDRTTYVGAGRVLVSKITEHVDYEGSAPFTDWVHLFELEIQNLEEYYCIEIAYEKKQIGALKTLLHCNTPELIKQVNAESKIILEKEDYELKQLKLDLDRAKVASKITLKIRPKKNIK